MNYLLSCFLLSQLRIKNSLGMAGHDIGSGVDIINIVHHLAPQNQTKQKTTLFLFHIYVHCWLAQVDVSHCWLCFDLWLCFASTSIVSLLELEQAHLALSIEYEYFSQTLHPLSYYTIGIGFSWENPSFLGPLAASWFVCRCLGPEFPPRIPYAANTSASSCSSVAIAM